MLEKIIDIKISLGDQVSKGDSILEIEFEEINAGKKSNQSTTTNSNESNAIQSIPIPDLGDAEDVEVIELCVKVGDKVNQDDSIIVLESEKAAMEVPTPVEGVIKKINVDIGDKVSAGNIFLEVETLASSLPISIKKSLYLKPRFLRKVMSIKILMQHLLNLKQLPSQNLMYMQVPP